MMMRCLTLLMIFSTVMLSVTGCGKKDDASGDGPVTWEQVRDGEVTRTNPDTGVTWTILGIQTDGGDPVRAKQNAEAALSADPDMAGMVGLWAYNPPSILQAVEKRDLLGKVKIVGFDEDPATIEAIIAGKIEGTIVQNPYEFGFRSVEYLSATIREQEVDVPDNKLIYIPTRVITNENVSAFDTLTKQIRAGEGPTPKFDPASYDTSKKVTVHFVTNLYDPFWLLAEKGCERAEETFNADVNFYIPPQGEVAEQKRHADSMIVNDADGLAISVIDPDGQVEMLNDWAKKMTVVTVDSDARNSDRVFYIGTDNIEAGRQAGDLLAQACPEGGKVIIFVGSLTQANGHERAQGVIDALFGQE